MRVKLPPCDGDFNPRSPHGERLTSLEAAERLGLISTHAPRTGSDSSASAHTRSGDSISTHAPRTGSDLGHAAEVLHLRISTHAPRTGSDVHDFARRY